MPRLKLGDFIEGKNKLVIILESISRTQMASNMSGIWLERPHILIVYPRKIHESMDLIERTIDVIDNTASASPWCVSYASILEPLQNIVKEVIKKDIQTEKEFCSTVTPNDIVQVLRKPNGGAEKIPKYDEIKTYRKAYNYRRITCGWASTGYNFNPSLKILYIR